MGESSLLNCDSEVRKYVKRREMESGGGGVDGGGGWWMVDGGWQMGVRGVYVGGEGTRRRRQVTTWRNNKAAGALTGEAVPHGRDIQGI